MIASNEISHTNDYSNSLVRVIAYSQLYLFTFSSFMFIFKTIVACMVKFSMVT